MKMLAKTLYFVTDELASRYDREAAAIDERIDTDNGRNLLQLSVANGEKAKAIIEIIKEYVAQRGKDPQQIQLDTKEILNALHSDSFFTFTRDKEAYEKEAKPEGQDNYVSAFKNFAVILGAQAAAALSTTTPKETLKAIFSIVATDIDAWYQRPDNFSIKQYTTEFYKDLKGKDILTLFSPPKTIISEGAISDTCGLEKIPSCTIDHMVRQAIATASAPMKQREQRVKDLARQLKDKNDKYKYKATLVDRVSGGKKMILERLQQKGGVDRVTLDATSLDKGAEKLYTYALSALIHGKHITKDFAGATLSTPLNILTSIGLYSDEHNARRGIKAASDGLMSITVNDRNDHADMNYILFTAVGVKNNCMIIDYNPKAPWGKFIEFFTAIPLYAYSLKNPNAFRLVNEIIYRARQEGGNSFKMKYSSLLSTLGLPSVTAVKKPATQINAPIEKAVGDVLDADKNSYFDIAIHNANEEKGIPYGEEWLKQSYLIVTPINKGREYFKTIADENKRKAIKAITKAKERKKEKEAKQAP